MGALATLADCLDNEGLSCVHIASDEDVFHIGSELAGCSLDIGAGIKFNLERIRHIFLAAKEACRDQYDLSF